MYFGNAYGKENVYGILKLESLEAFVNEDK
jgi:hypothetical protein